LIAREGTNTVTAWTEDADGPSRWAM